MEGPTPIDADSNRFQILLPRPQGPQPCQHHAYPTPSGRWAMDHGYAVPAELPPLCQSTKRPMFRNKIQTIQHQAVDVRCPWTGPDPSSPHPLRDRTSPAHPCHCLHPTGTKLLDVHPLRLSAKSLRIPHNRAAWAWLDWLLPENKNQNRIFKLYWLVELHVLRTSLSIDSK